MNIEFMKVSEKPTNEEQAANREFLRGGLKNPAPVMVGSVRDVRWNVQHIFPDTWTDFIEAIHTIERRCCSDEWIGTVEIYENGLNAFLRQSGIEHSTGMFKWRTS